MANDKTQGNDGFTYEVFKDFWDMFDPNLLQVYNEDIVFRSLDLMLNKDNIKFILKLRDPKCITS